MRIALRFWIHLLAWAGILLAIFTLLDQVGDDTVSIWARVPVWGGLALVLAAFPAGIAVSSRTFPDRRWSLPAAIEATLLELPERERDVVILRMLQEKSTREAARALGCAEGTVKATLHHALAKLRVSMEVWAP